MVVYQGIFFEEETEDFIRSLEKNKLPIKVRNLHCTLKIHPNNSEVFDDIVGEEVEVLLKGYGCDGKNSGFEVVLPDYVKEYYMNYDESGELKTPHIKTSLIKDAGAMDVKNMDFEPLSEPYVIKGRFGYCIGGRSNTFLSFFPQIDLQKARKRVRK